MNVINKTSLQLTKASEVQIPDFYNRRYSTGSEVIDSLFGGSIVPNCTFTISGEAGSGKTTLLMQILELLENQGKKTAYISSEEPVEQLAYLCKRINVSKPFLANVVNIDDITNIIKENDLDFVIVDSMPGLTTTQKMNSRQKSEYITDQIVKTAKENEVVIGMVLHQTKSKKYKGDTSIVHSFDSNFILSKNSDDYGLRDIETTKQRFGPPAFITLEMTSVGYVFEPITVINTNENSDKKNSKAEAVLNALDQNPKTIAEIASQSQTSGAYLNTIFRQLVAEGKAVKEGRGPLAIYKKA